jgi:hypothetical protein
VVTVVELGKDRYDRTIADVVLADGRIQSGRSCAPASRGGFGGTRRMPAWANWRQRRGRRSAGFGPIRTRCPRGSGGRHSGLPQPRPQVQSSATAAAASTTGQTARTTATCLRVTVSHSLRRPRRRPPGIGWRRIARDRDAGDRRAAGADHGRASKTRALSARLRGPIGRRPQCSHALGKWLPPSERCPARRIAKLGGVTVAWLLDGGEGRGKRRDRQWDEAVAALRVAWADRRRREALLMVLRAVAGI